VLPSGVLDLYLEQKGIREGPYKWQVACVNRYLTVRNRRLVYSLPTGAGKSLVAEVLMLWTLGLQPPQQQPPGAGAAGAGAAGAAAAAPTSDGGLDVLMIQPYVSIVEEKASELQQIGELLGFNVELFAGTRGRTPLKPPAENGQRTVYIATIEKALGTVCSFNLEKYGVL
jgi:POLQ-like helicase